MQVRVKVVVIFSTCFNCNCNSLTQINFNQHCCWNLLIQTKLSPLGCLSFQSHCISGVYVIHNIRRAGDVFCVRHFRFKIWLYSVQIFWPLILNPNLWQLKLCEQRSVRSTVLKQWVHCFSHHLFICHPVSLLLGKGICQVDNVVSIKQISLERAVRFWWMVS